MPRGTAFWSARSIAALTVAAVTWLATPVPSGHTAAFAPAALVPSEPPTGRAVVPILRTRWNVVVVMTDDQSRDMTRDMPRLRRLITRQGVQYSKAVVQTSVCCPSRASLLTGEFVGRHGVLDNTADGVPGGWRVFRRNGGERRTLAVELKRAGYATGLFGKYLNEYGLLYRGGKPPGWDTWRAITRLGYYGMSATYPERKGSRKLVNTSFPRDYSTSWAGRELVKFIRTVPRRRPLFALYTPYAPHEPATPERRYRNRLRNDGSLSRNPAFAERDVSDKPLWVRRHGHGAKTRAKYIRLDARQRETLLTVDDQIGRIVAALRRTGRWQRTLFVFMSDNGLMNGVHRVATKYVPYRRATEVPLMIRYGRDRAPITDPRAVAANVDVAATILAVAGRTRRLARIDGVPLVGAPGRSGVPLTGAVRDNESYSSRPPYCGWRTPEAMYVRYGSGEEEFYDYATDPHELRNRVAQPALAQRVDRLRQRARRACSRTPVGYGPSFDRPTWTYVRKGQRPRAWTELGAFPPLPRAEED